MMNTIVLQRIFLLGTLSVALCTSLSAAATLTPEEQLQAVLSNMVNYISSQEALDTQVSCSSTDQNIPIQSILKMHAEISKQCQELEAACINIGCTRDTQGNLQAPTGVLQERAEVTLQMLQASRTFCENLSQNLLSIACLISLPDEVSDKITLTRETEQALQTFVDNNRSTCPLPDIFSTPASTTSTTATNPSNNNTMNSSTPDEQKCWAAVENNNCAELTECLAKHPDFAQKMFSPPEMPGARFSLLHQAAIKGHTNIAQILLNAGAPVDVIQEIFGQTALCFAVRNGHIECTTLLLQHGANPNIQPKLGNTPLKTAAESKRYDDTVRTKIITALITHGATVTPEIQSKYRPAENIAAPQPTPLYAAVRENNLAAVQQILASDKSSINTRCAPDPVLPKITETPLHAAAQTGNVQIIRALIDAGANIEAKNISGITPLAMAVLKMQTEAVDVLLQCNAQTNVPCWGEVDVATTIANLYEIEDQAKSPSCIKIAELLIKHGASISPALQKSLCFTEAQKNIAASNSSMQQPSQGNSSTHSATASTPSTPSNTAPQATSTQPNRGPQPSTSSSSGPANPSGQADTTTQPTPAKSSMGYLTAGGLSTAAGLAGLWWVYTQEYIAAEKVILAQPKALTPKERHAATKELMWKNINTKSWAEKKALAASLAALTAGLGFGAAGFLN